MNKAILIQVQNTTTVINIKRKNYENCKYT